MSKLYFFETLWYDEKNEKWRKNESEKTIENIIAHCI